MKKDGGQLFTYFKFSSKANIIMLYSSKVVEGDVDYHHEAIKIEDDYRIGDVTDFYEKWNKLTKDNGVFDEWVTAYDFVSRALTPMALKEITQKDSSFIFNQFLEILRHNVVSDKPNAFNKIFSLFLCKVYDEKTTNTNEELKFQWLEGRDDDVIFQLRLSDLYKKGMLEFLGKEVTDFSNDDFEKKYSDLDDGLKETLLEEFRKLRLEKNNEFAIKEVFDQQSFKENAKVVKEVVELIQRYRIRYNERQQYLSDFFEMLLTTGLKQESGQFFTPVPIAQFIIKSLPIDILVNEKLEKSERNKLLPHIMDFAAGSGHFLTESMHEIQRVLDDKKHTDYIADTANQIDAWQRNHFDWATQYVYGIEKDYRLVKVGKVGCYLHGDGLANVILGDGLAGFKKAKEYKGVLDHTNADFPKENKQFDIIISNPPYSVSSFKNTSREYYNENDFDLYNGLTDNSSEIECLFVERASQLLKDGGLAGIILPSSILNNSGIYTRSRELILRNFEIIGIAELGSSTFMATGTNTVTLFLKRRNNYDSLKIEKAVNKFFTDFHIVTINGIENPAKQYIEHAWAGLSLDDYKTLLQKHPNEAVQRHQIYKEYLKKHKTKKSSEHLKLICNIEKEKLFYFILALPQKVVLINSGEKKKEKRFLGYEFSNRRGQEGIHPIQRNKSIDECTQLYDANSFTNPEKASTYVYKAFNGEFDLDVPENLQKNISYHNLVDMLTFDQANFEKNISLSIKKMSYEEVWGDSNLLFLNEIAEIKKGDAITEVKTLKGDIPVIAGGKKAAYFHNESNRKGNVITVSASGAYSGYVSYHAAPIFASDCNTITSLDEKKISTKLIFYFLKSIQETMYSLQRGQAQPHVYADDLQKIQIPLPAKDTQIKIVSEIEALEEQEKEITNNITSLKNKIDEIIEGRTSEDNRKKLGEIMEIVRGSSPRPIRKFQTTDSDGINWIKIGDVPPSSKYITHSKEKITVDGARKSRSVKQGDFILSNSMSFGRPYILKINGCIHDGWLLLRNFSKDILPDYLYYALSGSFIQNQFKQSASGGTTVDNLNIEKVKNTMIPLPLLSKQKDIVSKIDQIETKIKSLESKIAQMAEQKEVVLQKYLN